MWGGICGRLADPGTSGRHRRGRRGREGEQLLLFSHQREQEGAVDDAFGLPAGAHGVAGAERGIEFVGEEMEVGEAEVGELRDERVALGQERGSGGEVGVFEALVQEAPGGEPGISLHFCRRG